MIEFGLGVGDVAVLFHFFGRGARHRDGAGVYGVYGRARSRPSLDAMLSLTLRAPPLPFPAQKNNKAASYPLLHVPSNLGRAAPRRGRPLNQNRARWLLPRGRVGLNRQLPPKQSQVETELRTLRNLPKIRPLLLPLSRRRASGHLNHRLRHHHPRIHLKL